MFYRRESLTEQAVVAKLTAFQTTLEEKKEAHKQDVHAYFLLEVLNEALKQLPVTKPLAFPLDRFHTQQMKEALFDQYQLVLFKDGTPEDERIFDVLCKDPLSNYTGVGLYKNDLYQLVFNENGTVQKYGIKIEKTNENQNLYKKLIHAIQERSCSWNRECSSRRVADSAEREWIAQILTQPNEQEIRAKDLFVVIKIIAVIQNQLEAKCRLRHSALMTAMTVFLAGAGSVAACSAIEFLLFSNVTFVAIAFVSAIIALCVFYLLGLALYCCFNEKHWGEQLSRLHAIANQTKTYDFEGSVAELQNDMPKTKEESYGHRPLKTEIAVDSENLKQVRITTQYPTLRALFAHHEEKLLAIEPSLRQAYP